jgi:hypothetical protein
MPRGRPAKTLHERLQSRLKEINLDDPDLSVCWFYFSSLNSAHSTLIKIDGKMVPVRRVVFEKFRWQLPPRVNLRRSCNTVYCVNPWHIRPLTIGEPDPDPIAAVDDEVEEVIGLVLGREDGRDLTPEQVMQRYSGYDLATVTAALVRIKNERL